MSVLGRFRKHVIDLGPLRRSREFRLLFLGSAVSDLGNEITFVTMPFQVYDLTRSTLAVGLLGLCDLVPVLFMPVIGGMVADTFERRRMVMVANAVLTLVPIGLAVNALQPEPRLWAIYVGATLSSTLWALQSPAVRAWPARLFGTEELPSVFALVSSFYSVDALAGPAVAGLLIGFIGIGGAYLVDVGTFFVALVALGLMQPSPPAKDGPPAGWGAIREGLRFLRGKKVVRSTYTIDLAAMVFGMPIALFPAIADRELGIGPELLGLLYAAPAVGSLLASVFSGQLKHVRYQGRAIMVSVTVWGAAIVAFGLSHTLWLSLVLLAIAGAGDMVSGVFRTSIAQTVVSDEMRGRLEGMGLAVWATGPALGDVEAGVVASVTSVPFSVISGGVLTIVGVVLHALFVPRFRAYDARDPHA